MCTAARFILAVIILMGPAASARPRIVTKCDTLSWGVLPHEVQEAYDAQSQVSSVYLGFKTEKEANQYFGCYHTSSDPVSAINYTDHYRAMIRHAADSFGIPFSLLACLFYRESSYWQGTSSAVGARGLGQVMPETVPTLNLIIKSPSHSLEELQKKARTLLALSRRRALTDRQQKDLAFFNSRIKVESQFELVREGWRAYWHQRHAPALLRAEALRMDGSSRSESEACNHPSKPCAAEMGIVAGAALLKYYSLLLGTPECTGDHWLIAVGSYNLGAARMAEFAPREGPVQGVIDRLHAAGIDETVRHMESIRNCAQRGSWEPMAGSNKVDCYAK